MNPDASGLVTMTFNDTELTPVAGTYPARSVSCTSMIPSAGILVLGIVRSASGLLPGRVSKTRLGPTEVKAAPVANQPLMSTTMSVGDWRRSTPFRLPRPGQRPRWRPCVPPGSSHWRRVHGFRIRRR